MQKLVPWNLNYQVRVKVTTWGQTILMNNNPALYQRVDDDGYLITQMWEIMEAFGKSMYMGNPELPIDCNVEIMIEENR